MEIRFAVLATRHVLKGTRSVKEANCLHLGPAHRLQLALVNAFAHLL